MSSKRPTPKASSNYMGPVYFGLAVIFLTFGVAGGWAAIAPLDSAVVAPGVIAVDNNRKTVQHLEGGIVSEILVKDGDRVEEGTVLFRLDTTQASASDKLVRQQMHSAQVLEARLLAERDGLPKIELPEAIMAVREEAPVAQAILDETKQFLERKASLDGQTAILRSRIDQAGTRVDGLETEVASLREQIELIDRELSSVRELFRRKLVSQGRLLALERERAQLDGQVGRTIADITTARETITESELQIAQLRQERVEETSQQISDVRRNINELRERIVVSADILKRTAIVAPRSGQVINLKVFTVGQVIRAGDTLLEIVPDDEGLVINAQVSPLDIDAVAPGMEAEIRFSAFKSRGIPIITGAIREISPDRLIDEQTRQPYFLARIHVADADIPEDLKGRLTPGMPGDIIFPTGERTVLQYLTSPMQDAFHKAFTEE